MARQKARGTIRNRAGRWTVQIYLGLDPVTGKKRYRIATFDSEREAKAWRAFENDRRSTLGSSAKLAEVLDGWMAAQEYRRDVTGDLSPSTVAWYQAAIDSHLKPTPLAAMKVDSIDEVVVRRFLMTKKESGRLRGDGELSASSLRRLHVTLNAVFGWATKKGIVATNPMADLRAPRLSKTTAKAMSAADLRTFINATRRHRLHAAFHLLAVTGCRRGELLGLRWEDISTPDIGQASITIRRQIKKEGNRPVVGSLKTESSMRRIPLDDATVEVLERWRAEQEAEREAIGDGWVGSGFVFTNEAGETIHPDWFTNLFSRLARESGLGHATPHVMRHTAATLMLEAKVPTKVVSDVLGHESVRTTTDIYQATVERMGREAVAGLGALLTGDA